MKKYTIHEGLPLAICGMTGALSALIFAYASPVNAQIVPDATLPANSIVTPDSNSFTIEGGTIAGSNLFHSFTEFGVPTGAEAFFNNSTAIDNIITRVTGGNISNIDGLIRANGTASLFLLNPNGIIFGPNARLNIGGSFFGSTAEGLLFEDGTVYSATNPEAPRLLTINVPLGLQYGPRSAAIQVLGPPIFENPPETPAGLQVNPGQTLGLLAGEITLDGVLLKAPSGRIELGSVGSPGQVSLSSTPRGWVLGYEGIENFQDISLSRGSVVDTSSDIGGGNIQVQSRSLFLGDGSKIVANSSGTGPGGSIEVRGTEAIELSGRNQQSFVTEESSFSSIGAEVSGEGDGGEVTISTGRLLLDDGARIFSTTSGAGKAGDLRITASESVVVRGVFEVDGQGGRLLSEVNNEAIGDGGDIIIETGRLILSDGGNIRSWTLGQGNAGNIAIGASEEVELKGKDDQNGPLSTSRIVSETTELATGDAGDIAIETGRLIISDGGRVSTATESSSDSSRPRGEGNAGNIIIRAADSIELSGFDTFNGAPSVVRAEVRRGSIGTAGDILIETGRLILDDGGRVSSRTEGQGNAGQVTIIASELVELRGRDGQNRSSNIETAVARTQFNNSDEVAIGMGDAGEIAIQTGRLILSDGAGISSETDGVGNGGSVTVRASELVELRAGSRGDRSTIRARVASSGVGNAGNVIVETSSLSLDDGAAISSETRGEGNGGNVEVRADELIVNNSQLSVSAETAGNFGAGTLEISADKIGLENQGSLLAETAAGNQGNIILQTQDLQLRGNSQISTNARETATGGNITITTDTLAALENSDITANAVEGAGGNIIINTQGIFLSPDSEITASSQFGLNGTVTVNTPSVDPSSGLVEQPESPVDAESLLGKDFCSLSKNSSFVITGRGGIASSPYDVLTGQISRVNLLDPVIPDNYTTSTSRPRAIGHRESGQIVEATGWIQHRDGTIELVASGPDAVNPGLKPASCRDLSENN